MAVACLQVQDSFPWYAVRVRPRYEKRVAVSLESKGIHTLLPLYVSRRRWCDRVKQIELPLFDGYLFCQTNPEVRLPVLVTPGVIHFVGSGNTPIPIDQHEIEELQTLVRAGSAALPWPFMREGDRVRVEEGPLRNLEGILVHNDGTDQVVISVTLLQRSVAVRVDRAWLRPMRSWLRAPSNCTPEYLSKRSA
jgi:transcription antitermination factor NusG